MKLALLASALVVAGLGAAIWWGSMHWSAATAQIVDRLRDRSDVRTPARSISVNPHGALAPRAGAGCLR